MRRQTGARATALAALTTVLVAVGLGAGAPAVAAPTTSPTSATPTVTTSPTGTKTASPTSAPTGSTTATPTPATKGIPATFTGRLAELRTQATGLQSDLTAKQAAATIAVTTANATARKVQQALATAAAAQTKLTAANAELGKALLQVQLLARDAFVERLPDAGTALLLTSNPSDLDFTVAALGYLADRGADVYNRFTAAKAAAASYAAAQQTALANAKTFQATADTQRASALTALGVAQTQKGAFVAAVTALRDDAAKAAAAGPLSPADTAAYQAFLTELNSLGAGVTTATGGTTYVTGGPGQTPLPGTLWVKPLLKYTISSCYCARWGSFHHGVDLAAPAGTPIYAVGAGTVVAAGPAQGFGNWVVIDHHDGSFSIYGHMRVLATVVGAQVTPGELIAYVGDEGESTGYHLHFEVRIGSYGSSSTSTDPTLWLAQRGVTL